MNWHFREIGLRLIPGAITALGMAVLLESSVLQPLENLAHNALFQLRRDIPWDDRLVLVAIDDASVRRLGQFPWSRRYYAQLLDRLNQAEPSVVTFDLLFSESTPEDARLARSMAQSGRVVLGQAWDSTGLPLIPVAPLQDAALAIGHILTEKDADGKVRKIVPQIQNQPALGVATVRAYSLVQAVIPSVNLTQPLWLNRTGSPIQQYSFAEVMQGQIPNQVFRNKIVLVGVTASAIEPQVTLSAKHAATSGVYLQATVINNLLQQNMLHPIAGKWLLLILLLAGPLCSWLLSYWRTEVQVAIASGLGLSVIGLGLLLLNMNYLLPIALPLGLIASTALTEAVVERLRMNALLQQQVRQLWQAYHADLVLRPIAPADLGAAAAMPPLMQRVSQLAALADQFGRSQSTQAAIAQSLSLGLLAVNRECVVWFCNPVASEWLEIQVGSQLENHLVPEWLSQAEWTADLQACQQGQDSSREVQKGDRWFRIQLEPLIHQPTHQNKNPVDGLLLLIEDTTKRKQIEENLDQQIHELHKMNQLKDDFLSTVSHELRTPLTNIKMAIQLLKISTAESQRSHYLKILENECNRETELINDLLDLQRLEAGVQITNPEAILLQDWLPPIIEPFYRRTEARQQTLAIKLSPHLPCLISDEPSLERILVELVNNACKYTPPLGEILVSANWVGSHVELTVRNGAEIPKQELTRIFERFYRVPQADPWKQGGTGLGLALVKKLVERLGGKIEVQSGSGETTFTVQLPIQQDAVES